MSRTSVNFVRLMREGFSGYDPLGALETMRAMTWLITVSANIHANCMQFHIVLRECRLPIEPGQLHIGECNARYRTYSLTGANGALQQF